VVSGACYNERIIFAAKEDTSSSIASATARAHSRSNSMARKRTIRAATAGLALAGLAGVWSGLAQDGERTLRDGVFSAAQATRGERLFESICTNCHEIAEFTGAGAYLEDVDGKPLWETFEYVWSEMPEDEPASLDPEEYAAVLAYIFSVYGLPSGASDLPIDRETLEAITITRPRPPGS
jgi:mono/diheme cytochrome c family protein